MWTETMTPGERMMSLMQTGWADRPAVGAFALGLIAVQTPGLSIGECYGDPVKFAKAYIRVQRTLGFDSGPLFGHASVGAAEFGGVLEYPAPDSRAQSPIIRVHPIDSAEKVDAMSVPEMKDVPEVVRDSIAGQWVMKNYPAGYNAPSFVCGSAFTMAGNAIGVEDMLMWMIMEPGLVHKVVGKMGEFCVAKAKYILKNVGPVMLFDGGPTDSNDLISPDQFEAFALPVLVETRKKALAAGVPGFMAHPCGDQNGNINLWARVPGTAAINFDFRTPLQKVVEVFGKTTMIVGNIEPAMFQYKGYDWVYDKTTECMGIAGTVPHGYMVGPGCDMPVSTPAINLGAMLHATQAFAQSKAWQDAKPR